MATLGNLFTCYLLQRVLETQLTWHSVSPQDGLSHQQSNQIIGQKINPQLLFTHLGRFTLQSLHP